MRPYGVPFVWRSAVPRPCLVSPRRRLFDARQPCCPGAAVKIATWNVNSIRQREGHVRRWLESCAPDLLVLQEIKCEAGNFPASAFEALGYRSEIVGQKAYN